MSEPLVILQTSNGDAPTPGTPGYDCWNRIGIGGDRSCPELKLHVHCRNCPVYASAAKTFFDRSAPSGYLEEWTSWLARIDERANQAEAEAGAPGVHKGAGVLIFRLDQEWLAFRTQTVVEVTLPRPVHRIPHRTNAILNGLVNLRGQLQLCFSLHSLLGVHDSIAKPNAPSAPDGSGELTEGVRRATTPERLIVLRDRERSEVWAFSTDEVHGVEHVARGDMQSVPSTLANPAVSFSQAILPWNGRSVGFLDEQRVFAALRSIGQ
jgi:chemotaxis-related protein WspD